MSIHIYSDPGPKLGIVNNAECVGEGILLAPDEQDHGQHGCWFLKRPPIAIFGRPLEAQVSDAAWAAWEQMRAVFPTVPKGCVPITPKWSDSFRVKVEREMLQPKALASKLV